MTRYGDLSVAKGLRHQQRYAEHELALGKILDGTLMSRMSREVGGNASLVEKLDITQQEYTLPRHKHVVEEDDAIHLVET